MSKCLIVGAAPSSHRALDYVLKTFSFDAIIAADGGYAALVERGIDPSAVFGDFDSLGYVPSHPHITQFDTHKDFTDLDLALQYAFDEGFDEMVVCDALVGRLDHTLGNLQLLIKYANKGQCIWGTTEEEVVVPLVAPGVFSALSFTEGAYGTLSVISHSNQAYGVTETGLEYGIEDALCFNHILWGVSNELIGKPARVSLTEGSLWVLFPLKEVMRFAYC